MSVQSTLKSINKKCRQAKIDIDNWEPYKRKKYTKRCISDVHIYSTRRKKV